MKLGQFISYEKKEEKLVPDTFILEKDQAHILLENEVIEASYLYWICNSKVIKICPNHHADLLRF